MAIFNSYVKLPEGIPHVQTRLANHHPPGLHAPKPLHHTLKVSQHLPKFLFQRNWVDHDNYKVRHPRYVIACYVCWSINPYHEYLLVILYHI